MAQPQSPLPLKYFIAVLYHCAESLAAARSEIEKQWGKIDYEGSDHEFDVTNYYEPEMSTPLYRRILALHSLLNPTMLAEMKIACNNIEDRLAIDGKRTVNLDAGYLDHNKVLLASAKEAGQKIYLDKGIYADLAGRWKAGRYQPFEWSFPDFKDGRYDAELAAIRQLYLTQIRVWKQRA